MIFKVKNVSDDGKNVPVPGVAKKKSARIDPAIGGADGAKEVKSKGKNRSVAQMGRRR
jgi:hypothetical protein